MDRRGIESYYDVILFLAIVTVAASTIFSSSVALSVSDEAARRDAIITYARETLGAIMSSTLHDATYTGEDGTRTILGTNATVESFLLEEAYLLAKGWDVSSFGDCNYRIEGMARSLITRAYRFSLEAQLRGGGDPRTLLHIGDRIQSPSYSAASDYSVGGESVRVTLTIWWV